MQQLPLQVGPPDYAVFESYFAGSNAALVHALNEIAQVRSRSMLWLWGAPQTGRSHLLQATVHAADVAGYRSAYLPVGHESGLEPDALDGMGELDVVCLDDVDQVAGSAAWEQQLFTVFEGLRARGARLVMSAGCAPLHARFELPDLASRFTSGATFRVRPLTDAEKLDALKLRSAWRGLDLPDDVAAWLLRHADRATGALFGLLDRLDREALAAQKRLTVPFVKSVLESAG